MGGRLTEMFDVVQNGLNSKNKDKYSHIDLNDEEKKKVRKFRREMKQERKQLRKENQQKNLNFDI